MATQGFVCDGTCAGNELGDCNHGDSEVTCARRKTKMPALCPFCTDLAAGRASVYSGCSCARPVRCVCSAAVRDDPSHPVDCALRVRETVSGKTTK